MMKFFLIMPVVSAVLSVSVALLILFRTAPRTANLAFAAGLLTLALSSAGDALVIFSIFNGSFMRLGLSMSAAGLSLMPSAWLVFSLVFAKAEPRSILRKWWPAVALAGAVSVFFMAASLSLALYRPNPGGVLSITALGRYFHVFLIVGLVVNLVNIENLLRSSKGAERWRIKYIIFGVGAIHSFFIYLSSKALLFSVFDLTSIPLSSAVVIISVAMMAVFIVKYRLMDIDIFVSRYVVYNSLTVLVVGAYLFATGLAVYGARLLNLPFNDFLAPLFVFVAILGLVTLFFTAKLRRKAQLFINRHFYKHKYEFRDKWMETIDRISSKLTVAGIEKTLCDMITETVSARAFLWLFDPASRRYRCRGEIDAAFRELDPGHPFVAAVGEKNGPFLTECLKEGALASDERVKKLMDSTGARLCAPLAVDREIIGFLLISEDLSGEEYRQDDFDLLKAVATQAAVQIKNTRLAEDIMDMKEMEVFSRMSAFIMHDLKNLTNSLSLVSQNARDNLDNIEFQKDAVKAIDSTVTKMKGLIERLSSVPRRAEVAREFSDLNGIVKRAIEKMAVKERKDITIERDLAERTEASVDPEALEMVVLNLIVNAYEAIQRSGRITVRTFRENGRACISVADDGPGIPGDFLEKDLFKPFKSTKKNGFGIGLFQCRHMVEAQDGAIDVKSSSGAGTVFKISFPAANQTGRP